MGYRTYYNLAITNSEQEPVSDEYSEKIIADLRWEEHSDVWYAIGEDGNSQQDTTWNDIDTDMKTFSLKYPDNIFEISGQGDESDDLWSTYYKNGKMQHCSVEFIYPPFDETKLI